MLPLTIWLLCTICSFLPGYLAIQGLYAPLSSNIFSSYGSTLYTLVSSSKGQTLSLLSCNWSWLIVSQLLLDTNLFLTWTFDYPSHLVWLCNPYLTEGPDYDYSLIYFRASYCLSPFCTPWCTLSSMFAVSSYSFNQQISVEIRYGPKVFVVGCCWLLKMIHKR